MGILDSLNNADSAQWASYFNISFIVLAFIFMGLVFIGVIVFSFWMGMYNTKINIYDLIDGKVLRFLRKGRARIQVNDGVSKLRIWGIKMSQEAPSSDYYMLTTKGKVLNLLKDGQDFKPFKISPNPGVISISDHDIRFWQSQTVGAIVKKYTELSFFQKYGAYLVFVFGMLVLGWMYYMMLKYINTDLQQTTEAASALSKAIQSKLGAP